MLRGLNFILRWAERRNQILPQGSIAKVLKHLETQNPDDQIRIERQSYDGVPTKAQSTSRDWNARQPASHFSLMDQVSEMNMISPYLTARWSEAKEQMNLLKGQGLLR